MSTTAADAAQADPLWEELAGALRKYGELDDGSVPWHERYDEADLPPGLSQQDAAVDLALGEAIDAMRALGAGCRS